MKRNRSRSLAVLVLLGGLLVVGGIAWRLGWSAGTREQMPPAPPTTAIAPTATPTDMPTALPTVPPNASPTATKPRFSFPSDLAHPDQSPYSLTVVHTNDTWGYTRPCG